MRRARIKAMATVPARRKPAKDARDEKDERPNATEADGTVDDATKEAQSQEVVVHRAEEVTNENFIQSVGSSMNAMEFETDTAGVSAAPSALERVEASDRAAENCETRLVRTSSEERGDVAVRPAQEAQEENAERTPGRPEVTDSPQEVAEPKGSGASENVPMAKQPSQTRTSFMRPSPRLDGGGSRIRRNSVHGSGASASESEDDCHRRGGPPSGGNALANRVRNDSVGSTHSPNKAETPTSHQRAVENLPNVTTAGGTTPAKNVDSAKPRQKRKINVSESARKLAEARREFLLKYEHKQPDRTKLTMYDLIYYNPVTNPIKKTDSPGSNAPRSNAPPPPRLEDDDEDDDECDAGEAKPVPQVKVGPDGHLVLDERSLVIEHTGAQKSREALARTEALVDDDSNGNGFYKRRQKTRDWPKWETLKFYKALNTVGTDFLLMQSLFPERTRNEIKMKFKKEEKLNQRFVEKALVYHQEFNIESLQQDLASFEETEARESESVQCEKPTGRRSNVPKRTNDKSRRLTAASIDEAMQEEIERENVEKGSSEAGESPMTLATSQVEKKRPVKRRPASSASSSSSSSSPTSEIGTEVTNEYESDPEVYFVKPTRSGRYPKIRKLQAPAINTLDNLFSDPDQAESEDSAAEYTDDEDEDDVDNETWEEARTRRPLCHVASSVSDIGKVVPGSLVIVSRESPDQPGETVLQVYMVSSDLEDPTGNSNGPSMTPIKLTPELLDTVTAGISNVDPMKTDDN